MLSFTKAVFIKKIIPFIGIILLIPSITVGNPNNGVGIIMANRLSVRKGPDRNESLIKIIEKDDTVIILENRGKWLKIEHNGTEGFIRNRKRYVKIVKEKNIIDRPQEMPTEKPNTTTNQPDDSNENYPSEDPSDQSGTEPTDARIIQQKIQDHESEIVELKQHETKIISKLSKMEISLNNIRSRITVIRNDIETVKRLIKEITTNITEVKETIKKNEFYSSKRLSTLYKLNRLGTMHILASSNTINGFFRRKHAIETILAYDENLLNIHLENKKQLESLLKQHINKKKEKERLEADLEVQISHLSSERNKRNQILEDIRDKKSLALAAIDSLKQAAAALDQTILSLNVIDKKELDEGPKKKFSDYKGLLKMPVEGKIIANFGPYKNIKFNILNFRSGIEIGADRGEPIRAVLSGHVLYASWFKGYGNMIIIDHGDNYYTVYAHAEEIFKKRGDQVDVEEVIATVGDTASMVGTSLYFEVRHHGKPMNPLKWLKNS